ncbi:hypothetical protein NEIMUCOT_06129 [Neisseria mucosa ATCC 25996]|uniref:Uncharacterized protein n=1 Tax=Neisseria mucosa (strain ATCC 25996 / DSM 4631 / NCTC 10774 / M26) TaxID=546266 RepID=D2ZZQ2_NEIM2|nr:hypothetical protein NEIMUCOT_06129 [Neisseria mucosa ATCC 25996]
MLQFRPQAQAGQQRFTQKTPAGDDGQKMRFINHDKMFIDKQNLLFKRNLRFAVSAGFTVIKHRLACFKHSMLVKRHPVRTHHEAAVQPPAPIFFTDKRKACAEKMQERQAVELFFMRQHQIAGLYTV